MKTAKSILKPLITLLITLAMLLSNISISHAASNKSSLYGYSIPSSLTIEVGKSATLKVTEPKGKYANLSFQYCPNYVKSSNYCAGSYWGKKGQITYKGIAPGSFTSYVTVQCHTKKGDPNSEIRRFTLECKVTVVKKKTSGSSSTTPTVKKVPLKSISLNKSSATLNVGEQQLLTIAFNPSNTTDSKTASWTTSNSSVATVNSSGIVTTKKAGTATITAKVGSKTASCKFTVKKASTSTGSTTTASDAYSILNTFRTTKANQWYWNSDNRTKTYTYNLKKLNRDAALEKVAQERAKEQWTQYYVYGKATHDRINGSSCWTAYPAGTNPCAENLAWGYATADSVINQGWAETNQNYNGQGHRRAMLSSYATKVGIASYTKDGHTCWAMCFGR